jgi:NAD(P)-dependent dehydrogenase (short-subunit alcohol dehydrogenase family)
LTSAFDRSSTAAEVVADLDLTGQRFLVTGGYAGLGLETSRALAGAGANVVVAGRDLRRAGEAATELRGLGPGTSEPLEFDLARGESIDGAVARLGRTSVNGVICNAGVMACPLRRTDEGWEWHVAVNVLGHARLLWRLIPALRLAEGPRRAVLLSSTAHHLSPWEPDDPYWRERDYDKWLAYGQSKTADSLLAVGLQQTGLVGGLDAFAVHPGGILTDLQRHLPRREMVAMGWVDEDGQPAHDGFKTVEAGASTQTWAATDPALTGLGGRYLEDCAEAEPAPDDGRRVGVKDWAIDTAAGVSLWEWALREQKLDPNALV